MLILIILAGSTMLLLTVLSGYVLGWANKAFHVQVDPKLEGLMAALPGANCGGCGYVGCNDYALGVFNGEVSVNKCTVGGGAVAQTLARIMGVDLEQSWPFRAVVHCGAATEQRLKRNPYQGERTCTGANLVAGVQGCTYGCLGMGDCEQSCQFDAIHVVDGLASVDYDKCTGCGACERACPRHIITMVPFKAERMLIVACSNKDFGKDVKAVCKVGCVGCKACERATAGLLKVTDNIPKLDYDKYDPARFQDIEVAFTKCPMKRLIFLGKPREKDLAAVADQDLPAVVPPAPETTVDKTEWHG